MENKSSQSSLLIGIVIALLVAAVAGDMIYHSVFGDGEGMPSNSEVSSDAETAPEPAAQSSAESEPEDMQSVGQEASQSAPEAEPETEPAPSAEADAGQQTDTVSSDQTEEDAAPEISLELQTVRVDSDGAVVIAGTGAPAQLVEILVNGEVVESALADGQGNFVSLFDLPYSDVVRILSLRSIVDGKEVLSNQDAIIASAQIAAATPSAPQTEPEPETRPEPTAPDTEILQADAAVEAESQSEESNAAKSAEIAGLESDQPVADSEAEKVATLVQDGAGPAEDSVAPQNQDAETTAAEPVQTAEPAKTDQDRAEAPVVAAADEPGTSALTANANDSVTAATDTQDVAGVSASEQVAEPEDQSETEIATANDPAVETAQVTHDAPVNEPSTTELAAVSTKDIAEEPDTQEPASQQSETRGSVSDSSAVTEAEDSQSDSATEGGATQTVAAIEDTMKSPDCSADQSVSSDEATTDQSTADGAETAQAEAAQTTSEDAGDGADQARQETSDVAETAPEVQADQAPTVMIADQDGVRVVQGGGDQSSSDVALDAISYDEEGEVALSGRGTPAAQVMVYLDNAPISSTVLDSAGQWKTDLTDVDPGVYTLGIDQLDTSGKVVSRLETPFQRESRERLIQQVSASAEPARVNVVTVQPGYTLWAIARNRYGRGILYVHVFVANRDKIRDPDLIYPGQVFKLPD